eukprot:2073329-Pleurochrysis_carterae.AAC.1
MRASCLVLLLVLRKRNGLAQSITTRLARSRRQRLHRAAQCRRSVDPHTKNVKRQQQGYEATRDLRSA